MLDLTPTSVLLLLLVTIAVQTAVTAIGKSALLNQIWSVYFYIASSAGKPKFVEHTRKRAELVQINQERKSISAQDQYARWTKLNRSFDRLSSEIKELSSLVSSEKASVEKAVNTAVLVCTTAPIWLCRIWFRKTVVFYFPPGYLPHAVEWFLSFPFTVTGGVGVSLWIWCVNSALNSIVFLLLYLIEPVVPRPQKETENAST
ncbi:Golgi to ER traffic protein 1 [Metschnikowia bicuspidata]|uniref:Golgi to ER traffic protein 1 n=1 Tax=Metschnikowia bicuspidata TaxID=27322 RepID=A0A4P9Z973_9ASCO|nr:Golgi to ER traffic protein 1 [Metschnikowia bicuspidata]